MPGSGAFYAIQPRNRSGLQLPGLHGTQKLYYSLDDYVLMMRTTHTYQMQTLIVSESMIPYQPRSNRSWQLFRLCPNLASLCRQYRTVLEFNLRHTSKLVHSGIHAEHYKHQQQDYLYHLFTASGCRSKKRFTQYCRIKPYAGYSESVASVNRIFPIICY